MNAKRREYMISVLPKRKILMQEVVGRSGYDSVHHHTRPQHSGARHVPNPSRR